MPSTETERPLTASDVSVREMSLEAIQILKDAMLREGITSLSNGAAVKWGATQYANHLRGQATQAGSEAQPAPN